MFSNQTIRDIIAVAQANGVEPAALLAVVEIESGGDAFEKDGVTPRVLFERHVFHRQLKTRAPGKLAAAVGQGLAHPDWRKATQYQDQKTVAGKLALLARARAIDEDCANRSCSWGLGQIMGFHAEAMGFGTATAMVHRLASGGFAAQIEVMLRFIRSQGIVGAMNAHDWERFARVYNGAGFKQNSYDTKLAKAYARWAAQVGGQGQFVRPAGGPEVATDLAQGARGDEVEALQRRLKEAGYAVGAVDGIFGNLTRDALLAFQADNKLATTGIADALTLQALAIAKPRPINIERENVTVDDLRTKGSQVINLTDWLKRLALGTGLIGGAGAVTGSSSGLTSILTNLVGGTPPPASGPEIPSDAVTTVANLAQSLIGTQGGLGLLTLGAAAFLWRNASQVANRRKEEHQTAVNLDK